MAVDQAYLASLSSEQLHELRLELRHAIFHPGTEFDVVGEQGAADEKLYEDTIAAIKVLIPND